MAAAFRTLLLLSLSCASALNLQRTNSCDCLGWKDAFSKHGADCGKMGTFTCEQFLMTFPNEKFCINHAFGQEDSNQWCYVLDSCPSGSPLTQVGENRSAGPMKFKNCSKYDASLGDKTPEELYKWTKANNLDVGFTSHYAYPRYSSAVNLTSNVLSFFNAKPPEGAPGLETLSDTTLPERLQAFANEDKTGVISSFSGHPPYGIMKGKKLYWINFSDEQKKIWESGKDFFSQKGTMNDLECVAGCEETVPSWMSPINEAISTHEKEAYAAAHDDELE